MTVATAETTSERLRRFLSRTPTWFFSAYVVAAAFGTYFCMYAFRKAFAAGTFAGTTTVPFFGVVDRKLLLLMSQVLGYASSKALGIKFVSEITPGRRAWALIGCILVSWGSLGPLAVTPPSFGPLWLFLNGLPLGMVWGLVFGFLEGRKTSDLLGAGLCASFIVASGFVKTVGKLVLGFHVGEYAMPFVTGMLFLPPFIFFVWLLSLIPPPTKEDEENRTKRAPMDANARRRFLSLFGVGLIPLTLSYVLLTGYRDFRDNFAAELWDALGFRNTPTILTTAEIPVAVGALFAVALTMKVRDNRRALLVIHGLMLAGTSLVGLSTLCWQLGWIGPVSWMIAAGLGLYVAYVPFNCVLFDRLIAATGFVGTAAFLIYVVDTSGYAGTVVIMLYKNFGQSRLPWLSFFKTFSYVLAVANAGLFMASGIYFARRAVNRSEPLAVLPAPRT